MPLLHVLPLLFSILPQEDSFRLRAGVDMVLLDTLASSTSSVPVPNLKASNFKIYVDSKEVPLVHFGPQDSQVALAFLIDASGSMRPLSRITAIAAQTLFNLNRGGDEASLIAFADKPQVLLGPVPRSIAKKTLLEELLLDKVAWQGRTSLYDAILIGLNGLSSTKSSRRSIVLFSDGGDNQSKATKADVVQSIRSQNVTVYAVALIDPASRELDERFLRQISTESGGRYFRVTEPEALQSIQTAIASDIRGRYVIGFNGVAFHSSASAKHTIRVECRDDEGKKLKTLARTIYYSKELLP